MYDINKIKTMSSDELKAASAQMEKELGSYVLKQAAIRIGTVLVVRWAIKRYL